LPSESPPLTERQLRGSIGGNISWGRTKDRSARTAPGRAAAEQRFVDMALEALGDDATDEQIQASAESFRKAHMRRIARLSVQARRQKKAS
jgi:hypothetical protein